MKILHIVPSIRIGGVLSIVYELSAHQRKNGDEVSLYVARPEIIYRSSEQDFIDLGVNIHYSKYSNIYDPGHIVELSSLMKSFDLVHVHLFPLQLWAALAYKSLSSKFRPKLLTTEHSTHNNRRNYKILKYFDRLLYLPYDCIVSISNQTKVNLDKWVNLKSISKKNIVISNGVNLQKIKNAEPIDLMQLGIPKGVKIVTMVSRLIHPKDPFTLLRAIKECQDNVHVVFVGEGPQMEDMNNLSKELGISSRVHLLGLRNDVASILKASDIGVLSTHWDGFGLVAVEYMAANLAVLASDVDGLRDVVGLKECLFRVGDSKALAQKISDILSNSEKRCQLVRYFGNRCEEFSIDKMNEGYSLIYKKYLTNK